MYRSKASHNLFASGESSLQLIENTSAKLSKRPPNGKPVFYNCIGIKTNIVKFFFKQGSFFLLIIKEIKTFLWAPKSVVGCGH